MSLREEAQRTTNFKRSLGYNKTFFTLLDFSLDKTYPKYYNKKNDTSYWMIPALFPQQPHLSIKESVKGSLLVSKTCLTALYNVLEGVTNPNPSFYGWYSNKTYHFVLLKVV